MYNKANWSKALETRFIIASDSNVTTLEIYKSIFFYHLVRVCHWVIYEKAAKNDTDSNDETDMLLTWFLSTYSTVIQTIMQ